MVKWRRRTFGIVRCRRARAWREKEEKRRGPQLESNRRRRTRKLIPSQADRDRLYDHRFRHIGLIPLNESEHGKVGIVTSARQTMPTRMGEGGHPGIDETKLESSLRTPACRRGSDARHVECAAGRAGPYQRLADQLARFGGLPRGSFELGAKGGQRPAGGQRQGCDRRRIGGRCWRREGRGDRINARQSLAVECSAGQGGPEACWGVRDGHRQREVRPSWRGRRAGVGWCGKGCYTPPDVATGTDRVATGGPVANMEFSVSPPVLSPYASLPDQRALRGRGACSTARRIDVHGKYHEMKSLERATGGSAIDNDSSGPATTSWCSHDPLSADFVRGGSPKSTPAASSSGSHTRIHHGGAAAHTCRRGVSDEQGGRRSGTYAIGEGHAPAFTEPTPGRIALEGCVRPACADERSTVRCAARVAVASCGRPIPTTRSWCAELGRDPGVDVELRRIGAPTALERALRSILTIRDEIRAYYWSVKITDLIESNISVGRTVIESARRRKESEGSKTRLDYLTGERFARTRCWRGYGLTVCFTQLV